MGLLYETEIKINIEVGDIIVLRNNEEHTVTDIYTDDGDLTTHVKGSFNDDYYWYTSNGFIDSDEDEDVNDIVKVIKHTELG